MRAQNNIRSPLLSKLESFAQYRRRREAVFAWNATNLIIKRGLVGALVHVDTDGSVQVNHGDTYKIPTAGDVPDHFKIELWPEANREDNVGGSKAVGEPPLMLAISVYEALRDAIDHARNYAAAPGARREPVHLIAPATAENVLRALQAP